MWLPVFSLKSGKKIVSELYIAEWLCLVAMPAVWIFGEEIKGLDYSSGRYRAI
jgi:hypothetical protein